MWHRSLLNTSRKKSRPFTPKTILWSIWSWRKRTRKPPGGHAELVVWLFAWWGQDEGLLPLYRKYRGAAHNQCYLKYKMSKFIPVFFTIWPGMIVICSLRTWDRHRGSSHAFLIRGKSKSRLGRHSRWASTRSKTGKWNPSTRVWGLGSLNFVFFTTWLNIYFKYWLVTISFRSPSSSWCSLLQSTNHSG